MTTNEKALLMHEKWNGKLETVSKTPVKTREDLAIAYTPGVAEPCKVIAQDKEAAYKYTMKANTVAVVSDGSAVLGLGNIGPYAAMPVMEGKAVLFKEFGNVNAVPICLDTQDTEEIIKAVTYLAPGFGGINLEDISAPRCFEIEERLKEILDIPVFHDDQHGTAIVVLAGVINALKVVGKKKEDCRVVVNGAGSAGVAITKLLLTYGFPNIIMCDKVGIVSKDTEGLNWMQKKMTEVTNLNNETGSLADALKGADIFIGVSAPNIVTPKMVASMNRDSILFAMANPIPEIMPDVAKAAGARVVGTGRSDFPNQVNNVVAFPGIFKGALEGRATQITEEMKLAAAEAIAGLVPADKLSDDNIMPEAFDPQVAEVVANAVKSHGWKGPGPFMIIPVIDSVPTYIDQRVRVSAFKAEQTLTKDTVPVNVDAVVYWTVWDVEKAALEVQEYQKAIEHITQTGLRDTIGKHELSDLLQERDKIAEDLQQVLDRNTNPWGITCQTVGIKDIAIPQDLAEAMSKEAQAERERRARVILGTAETEIAEKFEQASKKYTDNPVALHLRGMNMLFEGLKEKGSMVIVPSSALDTMNLGAMGGLVSLAKNNETPK